VVVVSNGRRRPVSGSGVPVVVVVQLGSAPLAQPPAAWPEGALPASPAAGWA
jgi:hypothetical protein